MDSLAFGITVENANGRSIQMTAPAGVVRSLRWTAFATHFLSGDPEAPVREVVFRGLDLEETVDWESDDLEDQLIGFETERVRSAYLTHVESPHPHDLIFVEEGEEVGGEYSVREIGTMGLLVVNVPDLVMDGFVGSDPFWWNEESREYLISADAYRDHHGLAGREEREIEIESAWRAVVTRCQRDPSVEYVVVTNDDL